MCTHIAHGHRIMFVLEWAAIYYPRIKIKEDPKPCTPANHLLTMCLSSTLHVETEIHTRWPPVGRMDLAVRTKPNNFESCATAQHLAWACASQLLGDVPSMPRAQSPDGGCEARRQSRMASTSASMTAGRSNLAQNSAKVPCLHGQRWCDK